MSCGFSITSAAPPSPTLPRRGIQRAQRTEGSDGRAQTAVIRDALLRNARPTHAYAVAAISRRSVRADDRLCELGTVFGLDGAARRRAVLPVRAVAVAHHQIRYRDQHARLRTVRLPARAHRRASTARGAIGCCDWRWRPVVLRNGIDPDVPAYARREQRRLDLQYPWGCAGRSHRARVRSRARIAGPRCAMALSRLSRGQERR